MVRFLLGTVSLAVAVVFVVLVQRVPGAARRAAILTWAGLGIVAVYVAFAALFLIGETVGDPGGWRAVGLIAAWLVPLVGLSALAFYRPSAALPTLAVAMVAPVGLGLWAMVDFEAWRDWQDRVGPVPLVPVVVLGAALAVAGLSRTSVAGWLMVTVTVVPVVLATLGSGSQRGFALSVGLISAPVLISGLLYVWAGQLATGYDAHPSGHHLVGH